MSTVSGDVSPSTVLAQSLAALSTSVHWALAEADNRARQHVAKADSAAHDARLERDKALEALHAAQLKTQELQEEVAGVKATLNQTELCVSHHRETIAQLRREATQWKDQSRNWQEHFLRVEQEKCSLTTRIEELMSERLQWSRSLPTPFTPNHPAVDKSLSSISPKHRRALITSRKRPISPPDVDMASTSISGCRSSRTTCKPIQAIENKDSTAIQKFSPRDSSILTSNQNSSTQSPRTRQCSPSNPTQSHSHTTLLRRVHAIINVKQEGSDEEPEHLVPENSMTRRVPQRKRKAVYHNEDSASDEEGYRAPSGNDHEEGYRAPSGNDQYPEYEDNEETVDDEDDELMLGGQTYEDKRSRASRNVPSQYTPTSPSKRKTMAVGSNQPHARRKDQSQ